METSTNNEKSLRLLLEEISDRIMQRFDDIEQKLQTISPKSVRTITHLNGERIYDTQELCEMFRKSKRSIQRYRSEGWLEYVMIKHTTYYKESQVEKFKHLLLTEFEQKKRRGIRRKSKT